MITLPKPIEIIAGVTADYAAFSMNVNSVFTDAGKLVLTVTAKATPYMVTADGKQIPAGILPTLPAGNVEAIAKNDPAAAMLYADLEAAFQKYANMKFS